MSFAVALPVVAHRAATDWADRRSAAHAVLHNHPGQPIVCIGGTCSGKEPQATISRKVVVTAPDSVDWRAPPGADEAVVAGTAFNGGGAPPLVETLDARALHDRVDAVAVDDREAEAITNLQVSGAAAAAVGDAVVVFGGSDTGAVLGGLSNADALGDARLTILEAEAASHGECQIRVSATAPTEIAKRSIVAQQDAAAEAAEAAAAAGAEEPKKKGKSASAGKAEAEHAASTPTPLLWPSARRWHCCVAVKALEACSEAAAKALAARRGISDDSTTAEAKGTGKAAKGKKSGAKKGSAADDAADAAADDAEIRAELPDHAAESDRVFVLGGEGASGMCTDALWVLDVPTQMWYNPKIALSPAEAALTAAAAEAADDATSEHHGAASTSEAGVPWARAVATAAGVTIPSSHLAGGATDAVPCAPLPRARCAAVFVPERREIVVHGGWDGVQVRSDCWAVHVDSLLWRRIRVPALAPLATGPLPSALTGGPGSDTDGAMEPPVALEGALRPRGAAPAARCWHGAAWMRVPARYLAEPRTPTAVISKLASPAEPEEAASGGKGGKKGAKDKGGKGGKKPAKGGSAGKGASGGAEADAADAAAAPAQPASPWEQQFRLVLVGGTVKDGKTERLAVSKALVQAAQEVAAEAVARHTKAAAAAAAEADADADADADDGALAALNAAASELVGWAAKLALDETAAASASAGEAVLWALDLETGRWDQLRVRSAASMTSASRWSTASDASRTVSAELMAPPMWRKDADSTVAAVSPHSHSRADLAAVLLDRLRPIVTCTACKQPAPPGVDPATWCGAAAATHAGADDKDADDTIAAAAPSGDDDAEDGDAFAVVSRLIVGQGESVAALPGLDAMRQAASRAPVVWMVEFPPWDTAAEEEARCAAAAEAFARAPAQSGASKRECDGARCDDGCVFTGTMVGKYREGSGVAQWADPRETGVSPAAPALPVRFDGEWRGGYPIRGELTWSDGTVDSGYIKMQPWPKHLAAAEEEVAAVASANEASGVSPGIYCAVSVPALEGRCTRVFPGTLVSESAVATTTREEEGEEEQEEATVLGWWSRRHAVLMRKAGSTFTGDCERGVEHGSGMLTRLDGSWARGDWERGSLHGSGEEETPEGDVYVGSFVAGRRHGEGRVEYSRGGWYEGSWRAGKRVGAGELETPELHRYRGKFTSDRRNGLGHCMYADGGQYEGCWEDGLRHGDGTMVWASGRTYEGSWVRGCAQGVGKGVFPDEAKEYVGQWMAGKPHGRGRLVFSGGEPMETQRTYEGGVVQGRAHGRGRCVYADGCVYTGHWAAGLRNGAGVISVPYAGAVVEGTWREGGLAGRAVMRLERVAETGLEDPMAAASSLSPMQSVSMEQSTDAEGVTFSGSPTNRRDVVAGHVLRPRPRSKAQRRELASKGETSGVTAVVDAVVLARKASGAVFGSYEILIDGGRITGTPRPL